MTLATAGLFAASYEVSMPSRSNDAQRVIVGVASKSNVVLRVIVAGVSKADVDFGAGGMKRVDVGRQPSGGVFAPVCAAESYATQLPPGDSGWDPCARK
jgi:hypothetical protein